MMNYKSNMVIGDKRVTSKTSCPRPPRLDTNKEVFVCCDTSPSAPAPIWSSREPNTYPEAEDVIDLGAPRSVRRASGLRGERRSRAPYTPNPRLYPGPPTRVKPNTKGESGRKQKGRRKRVFQRPVPNARLYRPAPPRPPPPPAWPRAPWPPPAVPVSRALDTASRAALRLSERRPAAPAPPSAPPPPTPAPGPRSRHLVVTLPGAAGGDAPRRGGRAWLASPTRRGRRVVMDATNYHSTSPEDYSDGNDTLSAPSEFLAEFLSAIMQRQYAEALKYCRLILQYEPHNATARGFYPLLQHKIQAQEHHQQEGLGVAGGAGGRSRWARRGSSSEDPSAHSHSHEVMGPASAASAEAVGAAGSDMQQGSDSDSERSECGSQSSLELDSEASPPAAAGLAPAPAPAPHPLRSTDSASGSPGASSRTSGASGASGTSVGCWETSGSASRSDADDNGNALASGTVLSVSGPGAGVEESDVENDNASASLRRLRAQFACSIK